MDNRPVSHNGRPAQFVAPMIPKIDCFFGSILKSQSPQNMVFFDYSVSITGWEKGPFSQSGITTKTFGGRRLDFGVEIFYEVFAFPTRSRSLDGVPYPLSDKAKSHWDHLNEHTPIRPVVPNKYFAFKIPAFDILHVLDEQGHWIGGTR